MQLLTPNHPYTIYVKDAMEKNLWMSKVLGLISAHLEQKGYRRPNPPDIGEHFIGELMLLWPLESGNNFILCGKFYLKTFE